MSENIRKSKIRVSLQKKASLKRKKAKKIIQELKYSGVAVARLEDSKNLNALGRVVAVGTSFAHKRALEVADEVVFAEEGKIFRQIKGQKRQIIEHISPRRVTKGEVIIIQRGRA